MVVRAASEGDAGPLSNLRRDLWPEGPRDEHERELAAFFEGRAGEPREILVAEDSDGRLVGFCELSIRPYAEGCTTDRVGYLEGWYVLPGFRRQGVGGALVLAAESWARRQGCTEFASDAAVANDISAAAHQGLGFADVGLIRCFRKDLQA